MKSDITALEKKIEKLEKTIQAMAKKEQNRLFQEIYLEPA